MLVGLWARGVFGGTAAVARPGWGWRGRDRGRAGAELGCYKIVFFKPRFVVYLLVLNEHWILHNTLNFIMSVYFVDMIFFISLLMW